MKYLLFVGTRECKDLNIDVKCEHRVTRSALDSGASYQIDVSLPVRRYIIVHIIF